MQHIVIYRLRAQRRRLLQTLRREARRPRPDGARVEALQARGEALRSAIVALEKAMGDAPAGSSPREAGRAGWSS